MPRFSFRRSSLVSAIALTLVLGTQAANAADDDPRKAQAESLFAEGMKLHDKERNTEALEKYRQAYAVYPTANILFGIGRLEQLLGHRLEAMRHYREALRDRLLHVRNQELGKTYVAELERDMVRVDVKAPAGTTFLVAGKRFVLPLDEPLDFEPGTIAIDGTFGDKRYAGSIVGVKGSRVNLELTSVDGKSAAGTTNPTTTEPPPEIRPRESFWGVRSVAGLALVAVGTGVIIAGVAFSSEESSQQDKMDALAPSLPSSGAAGTRCSGSTSPSCSAYRDARAARDEADARASTFLPLGIGAAVVGVGLVASALIWPHKRSTTAAAPRTRLVPVTGRGELGLVLLSNF